MIQNSKFRLGNAKSSVEKLVREAIEVYNRYRGAEARAMLIEIENDELKVLFEGHFCFTCGVSDWIEDFKYVLEDVGIDADLYSVLEPEDFSEPRRVGVFKVRRVRGCE
ncbi:MAG: hypothetical protein LM583_08725 [Desulfurococcaceae archaeon]|jgi:hypothetical protein|nr:hypothetical protein [Desulfurococcaceae archaeon]